MKPYSPEHSDGIGSSLRRLPLPLRVADFIDGVPSLQRIYIDTALFICDTSAMTAAEVGSMMQDVFVAARNQEWDYVKSFPFVTRVVLGIQTRPAIPSEVRRGVLAAGMCVSCGSTERLVVDHIRPYSKGGTHDRANLQCLCAPCNAKKSNKWREAQ